MVPTVERGFFDVDFWSIETAGDRPSMKSTSGLSICPRNCRAYDESDSTYLRWPSAKIVSNARLDLRAGEPGEDDHRVAGQVEVDVAQVVLARASNDQT